MHTFKTKKRRSKTLITSLILKTSSSDIINDINDTMIIMLIKATKSSSIERVVSNTNFIVLSNE